MLGRWVLVSGGIFVVTFSLGLLLVGDQAGAFADSERAYIEIFSDDARRPEDLAGSLLVIASAVAFGTFALQLGAMDEAMRPSSVLMRVGGMLAAGSMLVAGAAFLTVPASLLVGGFFGDPGLVTAQPVLPHFGYISLVVGSAIPAAALMMGSTRLPGLPTWLRRFTFVAALLLVATSSSVITMLLLPAWVATLALTTRRGMQIKRSRSESA